MGVKGLESFVEAHPGAGLCYPVDLRQFAASLNGDGVPVVVVDLMSLNSHLYHSQGGLELLCGGQHRQFRDNVLKVFVDKLKACSLHPIFVRDCYTTPTDKRETWVRRRYRTLQCFGTPVFDALAQGKYPPLDTDISLPKLFTDKVLKNELQCEVLTTTGQVDADEEIVRLAKERKACAILAQDSDYLIYDLPDHVTYLSAKHLDLSTFKTQAYDRNSLAHHLSLTKDQLILLALMKGNDVLSVDLLRPFHNWLIKNLSYDRKTPRRDKIIYRIAEYIDDQEMPNTKREILEFIKEIVQDIFGDLEHLDKVSSLMQGYFLASADNSMKDAQKYHEDPHWNRVIEAHAAEPGLLFSLLQRGCYQSSFNLEDYRRSHEIPPLGLLQRPIRQRLYGFLFFEKPGALNDAQTDFVLTVDEWCYAGPTSLDEVTKQKAVMIPNVIDHPGLLQMKSPDFPREEKMKLFCHILSPQINQAELSALGLENLNLALQLFVMQNVGENGPILLDWEVKAFILTRLVLKTKTTQELAAIQIPPNIPDPRGVQLASLFFNNEIVWHVNAMFGNFLEEIILLPGYCLDGKLFQIMYLDLKHRGMEVLGLYSIIEKTIFDKIYDFVTNGGSSLRKY